MTDEKKRQIYAALSAPFLPEAIQRTDGRDTGKGYSTTGIGYQFIVNRLNEVLGIGSFRITRTMVSVREMKTSTGRPAFEAIAEVQLALGEWVDGAFVPFAEALGDGGHTSTSEADARKGAGTNGFKKAAAMFGCGRQAYEGSLDDDNVPERREPARADRNRLSGRQLNALQSLARQHGLDQVAFRERVKRDLGVLPEYLTGEQASRLISEMSAARAA
jgi:hypothetical protein